MSSVFTGVMRAGHVSDIPKLRTCRHLRASLNSFWCLWDFATFGRGTPAPINPPKRLVVHGLYRYVRNPMYLGVLLVILAWALYFASGTLLGYAALMALILHVWILIYEEPTLRRSFGDEFDRYKSQVNRWLPRVARRDRPTT